MTNSRDGDTHPPPIFRPRSQSGANQSQRPAAARTSLIRRQSASVGESSTLPRRIRSDRQLVGADAATAANAANASM